MISITINTKTIKSIKRVLKTSMISVKCMIFYVPRVFKFYELIFCGTLLLDKIQKGEKDEN